MKSTGIIRIIDELGRVVIPTALRKTMFGTVKCEVYAVEFFPQNDGTIILKRYEPEDKEREKEAIDVAIEALQEPERKWIPVSERLPKEYEMAFILSAAGTRQYVKAWQPLPEPYKAGEQE